MSTANKLRTPDIGAPVFTSEGEPFGTVKEIHGSYFKIDVPMAMDFWLKRDFIAEAKPDRVSLTLHRDEIHDHRLAGPGLEHPGNPEILESAEVLRENELVREEVSPEAAKARAGLFETLR
ncbi:MAG: hypothetical protein AB7N24_01290 [Dehalococcoidia bacterium]